MHGLGPRPARYIGINIISWELLLSSRCQYSEFNFNLKTSKQLKAKVVRAVTDQWPTNNSKAFKSTFVTIISFVTIIITRNPNHHHQDQPLQSGGIPARRQTHGSFTFKKYIIIFFNRAPKKSPTFHPALGPNPISPLPSSFLLPSPASSSSLAPTPSQFATPEF